MLAVKAASSTASRSCGWSVVNMVAHGPLLTAQPMHGSARSAGAQSHGGSSPGPMSAAPTLQQEASLLVALVLEEGTKGSDALVRRFQRGLQLSGRRVKVFPNLPSGHQSATKIRGAGVPRSLARPQVRRERFNL